jgi:hypothetical protein
VVSDQDIVERIVATLGPAIERWRPRIDGGPSSPDHGFGDDTSG